MRGRCCDWPGGVMCGKGAAASLGHTRLGRTSPGRAARAWDSLSGDGSGRLVTGHGCRTNSNEKVGDGRACGGQVGVGQVRGRGDDGAPYRSVGDFGMVPVLELGLGYAAVPPLRLEVLAEYRPRFAFGGHANFLETGRRQSVTVDLSSLTAMLAAYVDLAGLGVLRLGSLEPFVGAVHNRIGETRMTFPKTTTIVPSASRTDVAWMLTAGLAVPLAEGTTLDLAWCYTDLGVVRTSRGGGLVRRKPRAA